MRELTSLGDDTPKRAPLASMREAASADVVDGRDVHIEIPASACFSSVTSVSQSMVASPPNFDDLVLIKQEPQYHSNDHQNNDCQLGQITAPCRFVQTAQDKRSRLSNVINNLRRKVPESGSLEGDDRNSVERNLETLEKYVMTVLNGVIKDAETESRREPDESGHFNSTNSKEDVEINEGTKPVNHVPSEPSAVEPAVPDNTNDNNCIKNCLNDNNEIESTTSNDNNITTNDYNNTENQNSNNIVNPIKSITDESEIELFDTIILNRLNESNNESIIKESISVVDTEEIQSICRDLLSDLLNEINQTIEEPVDTLELPTTSLHCSLPLDKVGSILHVGSSPEKSCCNSTSIKTTLETPSSSFTTKSPSKASSIIRHLCLYCDRKFLSISLCQRHIERVHQHGGSRRSSDRNSRKAKQSCQYCSDKCMDNLEGLFQHMIDSHFDKYHACIQCTTRYSTKEALLLHTNETHGSNELDRSKEIHITKDLNQYSKDEFVENSEENNMHNEETNGNQMKISALNMLTRLHPLKDFNNSTSPDFDVSFYSSVSLNIRDNLLHHLDGKLQNDTSTETKQQQQQQIFHESASQVQFPIDISLTAATPVVENKEYSTNNEKCDNTSEYAQKPSKASRSLPRRVSFEKYNFPSKYDGKEQITCSIKDLSKFDIYTQMTLQKKQENLKNLEKKEIDIISEVLKEENKHDIERKNSDEKGGTDFTAEFGNFMRLRRWDECPKETIKKEEIVYAELTGEWSRPRVYICGACSSRHLTLKEIEEHKVFSHPNVWCSHLEFSGDQRELYKHLFLPGRDLPTTKAKNAIVPEKICTKCSKTCGSLAELHRHMLECGGDQAWLLGLFGNGKKKCKWRPFGSRSRRRRQRGMKRNIQNSQTPRANNQPRERQSTGPRVRPSDQETIQKMIANLPPKRLTRKVAEETSGRSKARLRKIYTRSRPHTVENTTSNTRLSRKSILRNKLLKNAKSFQRKRCRGDNISAAIESVINNSFDSGDSRKSHENQNEKINDHRNGNTKSTRDNTQKTNERKIPSGKIVRSIRVVSKRKNVKMSGQRGNLKSVRNTGNIRRNISSEKSDRRNSSNIQTKTKSNMVISVESGSEEQTVGKRKKSIDSLTSLNASLKAKSQLRTQDGKFARNPCKNNVTLKETSSSTTTSQTGQQVRMTKSDSGTSITRSKLRSSEKTKPVRKLPKRVTRLSCDSEKIPNIEITEKLIKSQETSKGKLTSDLPILSATMSNNRSTTTTKTTFNSKNTRSSVIPDNIEVVRGKRRKRIRTKRRKNISLENNKPHTRSKKSMSISVTNDVTADAKQAEVEEKNSQPELQVKKGDVRVLKTRRVRQVHRKELQKLEASSFDENKTLLDPKETAKISTKFTRKTRRNLQQLTQKFPCEISNVKSATQDVTQIDFTVEKSREKSSTRKSSRNIEKKKDNSNFYSQVSDNINSVDSLKYYNDEESVVRNTRNRKQNKLPEELKEQDTIEAVEPEKTEFEIEDNGEKESETEIEEKNTAESNNDEDEDCQKDIVTADLVSLSFEHLQQESNNSNIDSGKENSSETPVNISKPKVTRPKKSRGFRRDRVVKRSLNNVIGILTEGVNIPVEVQQSVVLTVQTSIENLATNSTVQNCRIENNDNNIPTVGASNVSVNENLSDSVVDDGNGESASQELQRSITPTKIETNQQPKLEIKTDEVTEKSEIEMSVSSVVIAPVSVEQPTNDIILDLSRRMKKGKGSFLEKIVSKIAKQKDALLEGEVGSLLDHAADELSIILDEVGSNHGDQKRDNGVESPKECNISSDMKNQTIDKNDEDLSASIITSTSVDEKLEIDLENFDDNTGKISKKRSLDIITPTKNKRKSVEEEEEEEEDVEEDRVEEERCLADIMKLINTPKKELICEISEEKVHTNKRKINDEEKCKKSLSNSIDVSAEDNMQSDVNLNKKVRTEETKRIPSDDLSVNSDDHTQIQTETIVTENKSEELAQVVSVGILDETKIQSIDTPITDRDTEETTDKLTSKSVSVIPEIDIINVPEMKAVETVGGKHGKSKRSLLKKKSLADEHLDLSDDEKNKEDLGKIQTNENNVIDNIESLLTEKTTDNTPITNQIIKKMICEITLEEQRANVSEETFKVPEITDALQSNKKRSSKKKTSTNKTSDSTDISCHETPQLMNKLDEKSDEEISPVRSRRSSKRKVNEAESETKEVVEKPKNVIERRQTLKRKAKENIFLIEELIDFGDDIDSPPPTAVIDDNEEQTLIKENPLQTEKDQLPVSDETQHEDKAERQETIVIPTTQIPLIDSETLADDILCPKKRASGNLSVVHTKSGEILIVEKKRKFTKEVAKFFCDVCATSFTRKSSLKKHNLSQSHLLQISKSGVEQENQESMSPDDTTLSSIDRNETTIEIIKEVDVNKDETASSGNVESSSNFEVETIEKSEVIPVEPTFDSQLDNDLEDELLDEEICKITENMTHDEYVLTDHISPEGASTPAKESTVTQVTDIDLKSKQQKLNSAEKHLDVVSSASFEKNNIPETEKPSKNVCLDFSNITEKLKNTEFIQNNGKTSLAIEFDSDENSSSTNMSSNIRKLLDDPEMVADNKIIPIEPENIESDCEKSLMKNKKNKSRHGKIKVKQLNDENKSDSTSNKKSLKSMEKSREVKVKNRNKRVKKKSTASSSESESKDRQNELESENKNKIVNSVFGRVFSGEKVDKVREVLDDWVSRSESESLDESRSASWQDWKDGRRSKPEKQKIKTTTTTQNEKKNINSNENQGFSIESKVVQANSRCRQSKKRAEERISRAFEEESILYDLAFESKNQSRPGKKNKSSVFDGKSLDNDQEDKKSTPKHKKITRASELFDGEIIGKKNIKSIEYDDLSNQSSKCKITNLEDASLPDTNSTESIHTHVPSCPRERSSTPDMVSLTTRDSENDAEEATDMDDDEDITHGLSPLYTSNLHESSRDSESDISDTKNRVEKIDEIKRQNSNEFSGEKIIIRSPVSSNENLGVITIAPTDAIEDNALDVPQEIEEPAQKSRQGKVLNFDEELFVECCSRLKATTENELRGAKKIKLDHSQDYQRKDEQSSQAVKQIRDRWKDVESQNSLGSLLESVNQLLGEEIHNKSKNSEHQHQKRARNQRSERSSSPILNAQPDFIRPDNSGYEDSLDVAFEHNNKLRDKIQQRMRESENLIATSFSQMASHNDEHRHRHHHHHHHHHHHRHHQKNVSSSDKLMENLENIKDVDHSTKHIPVNASGIKNKINPNLDGFLDKALSNLLHNNGKHDQNGSTPMNVLAELACAQVPTSTSTDVKSSQDKSPVKTLLNEKDVSAVQDIQKIEKKLPKKTRNTIRELFEKKNEVNDRKQHEKSHVYAIEKEPIILKQKSKKGKRQDEFPLIRKSQFGGMPERKRRHGAPDRKHENRDRIKDVYEFDEEESQIESGIAAIPYRSKNEIKTSENDLTKGIEISMDDLMSRAIAKTLENGKTSDVIGKKLETMIERKFRDIESSAPKTKGALKAFHIEEKQDEHIMGPMDSFVERKQRPRRLTETSTKHTKTKKRNKNSKKRSRNAWYEDDSSDEFKTAVRTEDVGVGITKSQRTCSKGKQNLFAELSTSSESDYEDKDIDAKIIISHESQTRISPELVNDECLNLHEKSKIENWMDMNLKESNHEIDNKKSESDVSDHPLVIDERKDNENDQHNSDDETDNRSEQAFELDDLYREDSSVADSDTEVNNSFYQIDESAENNIINSEQNDLIPLDEALKILDGPEKIQNTTDDTLKCKTNDFIEIKKDDKIEEIIELPEKLTSNEKPEKITENLPLHVFLSRKVQESKKRKEEQLKKLHEDEERALMEFQPTRRQRKCAIGKQGLLAEISSSDEEYYYRDDTRRLSEKIDYDKSRKQKRESKEKRKERYMEKKHEQIIAKEQKAIEEEIHRELEMKRDSGSSEKDDTEIKNDSEDEEYHKKKHQRKKEISENPMNIESAEKFNSDTENKCNKSEKKISVANAAKKKLDRDSSKSQKKESQVSDRVSKKNSSKMSTKLPSVSSSSSSSRRNKIINSDRSRSVNKESKERRISSGKRDSDDEELRTTRSWNKVEEGVGVAIGRRKRAAAHQLYYWSSSSDDDEELFQPAPVVEEEDDRQEQHGWIVGDSHKRMITMLAMEKQLKENRRRSEDEFENGKSKSKKHRNSTS